MSVTVSATSLSKSQKTHKSWRAGVSNRRPPHHILGMAIEDTARDLRDEFAFLDDWEARYQHIIDLGKSNPDLLPEERSETTRVRGCASQVWLVTRLEKNGTLTIRAESDAVLVSGLIAILTRLYSGQTPQDVSDFDAKALFKDIGVSDTLTAQRSNGLASMLSRIKSDAESALG